MSNSEHDERDEVPTIALLLTEHSAGLLNAALAHFRTHVARSGDEEMQRSMPRVEDLQRSLVEEVRTPTVPKIDVEAVYRLSQLNQTMQAPDSPQARDVFSIAHSWLTAICGIAVYCDLKTDNDWHFGSGHIADAAPKNAEGQEQQQSEQ